MLKPLFFLVGCAALALPAFSANTYTFDPEYTVTSFEVEHLGFTTQRGRFKNAQGRAVVDFANHQGAVEFTIQTQSLDMGSQAWTVHVSSPGLFNVAQFPTITFKSDSLQFEGDKVTGADGQLTLLGISKPLHVVVNNFQCGAHPISKKMLCAGNIAATLKRSDYGMVKYIPTVSDEIKINVPVEAYLDQ